MDPIRGIHPLYSPGAFLDLFSRIAAALLQWKPDPRVFLSSPPAAAQSQSSLIYGTLYGHAMPFYSSQKQGQVGEGRGGKGESRSHSGALDRTKLTWGGRSFFNDAK